jgi:DNA-binding transcriptional LysR family regulator
MLHHVDAKMQRPMDWDNVRFFLAVYRQHSLRAAARHLGVDQATVGRRLSAFEHRLGAKLFARTPGGYLPTLAAETLLAGAERIEVETLAMARSAQGLDQRLTGQVRVATGDGIGSGFVIPAMAKVHALHPDIRIILLTARSFADINRDEADIAVRTLRPTAPGLITRKIGSLSARLYASPEYLNRRGRPRKGRAFKGHDLIMPFPLPAPPIVLCGEAISEGRVVMEGNSMLSRAQAAACGIGIALLLDDIVASEKRLKPIWPERAEFFDIWLVVHADVQRSARVRVVVDAIADTFHSTRRSRVRLTQRAAIL